MAPDDLGYDLRHVLLGPLRSKLLVVIPLIVMGCAEPGLSWPAGPDLGSAEDLAGIDGQDVPSVEDGTSEDVAGDIASERDTTDVSETDVVDPPDSDEPLETSAPDADPADAGPPEVDSPDGESPDAQNPDASNPDVEEPDCDDNNPCTDDLLNADGQCEHLYQYGVCCTANPHCDDGDACTDDVCEGFFCAHVPSCCSADSDCSDGESDCTLDTCAFVPGVDGTQTGHCVHAATGNPSCCQAALNVVDLDFDDGGPGPLTLTSSNPDIRWHVSEGDGVVDPLSAPFALRYGNPADLTYDSGAGNSGIATLPPIQLPGGGVDVYLGLDIFLAVENGAVYDKLEVQLIEQDSSQTQVLWHKGKAQAYQAWFPVSLNLIAWSGRVVTIRFLFDTLDGDVNDGYGVLLDNIQLSAPNCIAKSCVTDAGCNDGLGVTSDTCVDGACSYKQNSNFCVAYFNCDDGDPCTFNSCSGDQCFYPENTSCCQDNAQCEDGDPCTLNDCIGAYSQYGGFCASAVTIPGCCKPGQTCDDGDPCTLDACALAGPSGQCSNTPLSGCCSKHEDCDDGNVCSEDLCVAGSCQTVPICCADAATCATGDPDCTESACLDGVCKVSLDIQPGCCTDQKQHSSFSGGTWQGWVETEETNPFDGVGWSPVGAPAWTPTGSMHYGNAGGDTYDTGSPHAGAVESPAFVLPSTALSWLDFHVLLDNEYSNGDSNALQWDRLTVSVYRVDQPDQELLVWDSGDGSPAWWAEDQFGNRSPQWTGISKIDLTPMKGRTVRLRFRFDTIDGDANSYGGAWIDDVTVTSTCQP
ncbi:MAG: hypothetical protein ACI9WU_000372 [Myxococcota bacterium]